MRTGLRRHWLRRNCGHPARVQARRILQTRNLEHLRWLVRDLKIDLAIRRLRLKYSPDQPRVPAGSSDGGQWTSGNGAQSSRRIRLAGEIPTNDTPEVPKDRPTSSRERTAIIRGVATWLGRYGGPLGRVAAGAYWLYQYGALITAASDPPKGLSELQDAVDDPRAGYEIHHIVEQTSAEQDGFDRSRIDDRDNLVRIPTVKHWDINAWYQTKNEDFGGASPRDYLRGKSWDERRGVGLDALLRFGVLKP